MPRYKKVWSFHSTLGQKRVASFTLQLLYLLYVLDNRLDRPWQSHI